VINGLIWLAIVMVLGLLYTATITLALRLPSRVRIAERLARSSRADLMDRLLSASADLALCAAILRAVFSLALTLVVLRMCELSMGGRALAQYTTAFIASLVLVLIFGVAIPSAWAKYAGEAVLAFSLPALLLLRKIFYPIVFLLSIFDGLVRRLAGVPHDDPADDLARLERELLDAVSEGEKLGAVDEEEKEMIESVMDLRDTDVASIMTPRTEIRGVEQNTPLTEIKDLIRQIGHSRIPVFEETIDNVVGIIYAKDLLHIENGHEFLVENIMRPAPFIPETKNLRDLLHEFQAHKVHMAIVLDEYGGTAGLVTIEDILEELVGEIVDEYDIEEPPPIARIDDDTADVDARVRVEEINEELEIELPEDDDFETIGGFVFSTLGRIPETGDSCAYGNVAIEVIDAEPRRINRVRVHVNRTVSANGHATS
jgi:putative hemolysin